jgi:hypothetical protein
MNQPPIEVVTVLVNGKEIKLDPKNMEFTDGSISDFMQKEYGWIDYFGKQLELAQKARLLAEIEEEEIFSKKYVEAKDNGGTEQYAKAKANSDTEVVQAKKNVVEKKEIEGFLKAHLKAWDKNHDNVQNRGHSLRKELDKLNKDIYKTVEDDFDRFTSEA